MTAIYDPPDGWQLEAAYASEFSQACRQAATCEPGFQNFKRNKWIRMVVENVSLPGAKTWLAGAELLQPGFLAAYYERFQRNDKVGGAEPVEVLPGYVLSPTLARYIRHAAELRRLFGDLNGYRIAEIGSGYGGQCSVLCDVFRPRSYVLFDLPWPRALALRYLKKLGVNCARAATADDMEFDLVISNYALSELNRETREEYAGRVLRLSARGYIGWNTVNHPESLSLEAGRQWLEGALQGPQVIHFQDADPAAGILYWQR